MLALQAMDDFNAIIQRLKPLDPRFTSENCLDTVCIAAHFWIVLALKQAGRGAS